VGHVLTRVGARQPSAAPITSSFPSLGSNGSSANRRPRGVNTSTSATAAAAAAAVSPSQLPGAAAAADDDDDDSASVAATASAATMVTAPTSCRPVRAASTALSGGGWMRQRRKLRAGPRPNRWICWRVCVGGGGTQVESEVRMRKLKLF